MTLHPALFALTLVVLAAADDRELVMTWPDGTEVRACAKAQARGSTDPCEDLKLRNPTDEELTEVAGDERLLAVQHARAMTGTKH